MIYVVVWCSLWYCSNYPILYTTSLNECQDVARQQTKDATDEAIDNGEELEEAAVCMTEERFLEIKRRGREI